MKKQMICINCPRGCNLEVDLETKEVTGNFCPRGKEYALNEITCPKRTLTSTMRVVNGDINMVSIRTDKPLDKNLLFQAMKEINEKEVEAPINIGDILIEHICSSDVNIIATKEVKKKNG